MKGIEMEDKWKDHGWKAWKWSVARLTLHCCKSKDGKSCKRLAVSGTLQSPSFGIGKAVSDKDTTTPMLWGGKTKVSLPMPG